MKHGRKILSMAFVMYVYRIVSSNVLIQSEFSFKLSSRDISSLWNYW